MYTVFKFLHEIVQRGDKVDVWPGPILPVKQAAVLFFQETNSMAQQLSGETKTRKGLLLLLLAHPKHERIMAQIHPLKEYVAYLLSIRVVWHPNPVRFCRVVTSYNLEKLQISCVPNKVHVLLPVMVIYLFKISHCYPYNYFYIYFQPYFLK